MIPGMNPKQMQKMMKQMGISQDEIQASEVIIKLSDRQLVFSNPQVSKVDMMGQETYQVVGTPAVESLDEDVIEISNEDIDTVMTQANVSRDVAIEALSDTEGDLAEAILKLSGD